MGNTNPALNNQFRPEPDRPDDFRPAYFRPQSLVGTDRSSPIARQAFATGMVIGQVFVTGAASAEVKR